MADVTHLGASPARAPRIAAALGSKAFLASARLNQRPDDTEVLTASESTPAREQANPLEEGTGQIGMEQMLAVLAAREVIPHGSIDTQSAGPAVQQVVVDTLNLQALGAQREQDLQQQFLQQPLQHHVRTTHAGVDGIEVFAHGPKHYIYQRTERGKRMRCRHPIYEADVGVHRIFGSTSALHRCQLSLRFSVTSCSARMAMMRRGLLPSLLIAIAGRKTDSSTID